MRKACLLLFGLLCLLPLLGRTFLGWGEREQPGPVVPAPKDPQTEWQADFDAGGERRRAALEAVGRDGGPSPEKALPALLAALEKATRRAEMGDQSAAQESKEVLAVFERVGASAVPELRMALRKNDSCRAALLAVAQLGPAAEPALPEIYARYQNCPDAAVPDRRMPVDIDWQFAFLDYGSVGKPCANVSAELCRRVLERIGQPAIPFLVDRCKDFLASQALVKIGKPAIPELIRRGHTMDSLEHREGISSTLLQIGAADEKDIPFLIEEVRRSPGTASMPYGPRGERPRGFTGDVTVWMINGGDVLVSTGQPAVPALLDLIVEPRPAGKESEEDVREAARILLARIGTPALPALYTALSHRNPMLRASAVRVIGRLTHEREAAIHALPELRKALQDKEAAVRAEAANAFAGLVELPALREAMSAAVPDLTLALGDPEEPVRFGSVLALARFGPLARAALPQLQGALGDPSPRVRYCVAFALTGRVADDRDRAVPTLVALYQTRDSDDAGRWQSFAAGRLLTESPAGRKALLPLLTERLKGSQTLDARRDTLTLLAGLGADGAPAGPVLVPLLERERLDEEGWLACQVLVTLGPTAREATGVALRKVVAEGRPSARWLAFLALASVDPDAARKAVPEASGLVVALSNPDLRRRLAPPKDDSVLGPVRNDRAGWQGRLYTTLRDLLNGMTTFPGIPSPAGALEKLHATAKETGVLLAGSCSDNYDFIQFTELRAIGRCRKAAAEEVAPVLVAMLTVGHSQNVKPARDALIGMGQAAIPALRAGLKGKYPEPVMVILGLFGPEARTAVPDLIPFLALKEKKAEPNDHVRVAAAVRELGVQAYRDMADEYQWRENKASWLRRGAAETLGRIGPEARAALPNLIASFKDEDYTLRQVAIRAVARIGKDAVPPLIEALKQTDVPLRAGSAEALGRIGPDAKRALPHLLALRDNENQDPSVRNAAAEAIKRLEPE
jgi:HEAT repeat protein